MLIIIRTLENEALYCTQLIFFSSGVLSLTMYNEQVQRRMVEIFSQHRAEVCTCKTHVNLLLNYNVSGDSTEARSQFVEAGTTTGMQLIIIEVSDQPTIFETFYRDIQEKRC